MIIAYGMGDALLRQAGEQERNMILSDWCMSYQSSADVSGVPVEVYAASQRALIAELLPSSTVVCAVNPDEHSQVFGWYCADDKAVHYIYVKSIYRRQGLARALLSVISRAEFFTHRTHHAKHLAPKIGARFNPYLLRIT